ncbi:uncharacterized protein [Medicago truncatula]|uniref:uncharacterized protein n=1 Tax=Medicago truncatula TaxID=3880 RepID=UPI001967EEE7|nr:uncharacterized protein LOC112422540 [Medicago truncatula]
MRFLPHRIPDHYDDKRILRHRSPDHYDDTRFQPHQIPDYYDDTRFVPHRSSDHYDDTRFQPHRIPDHYDDMRFQPHRSPDHYDDTRFQPQPHRSPDHYDDTRFLPHRSPDHYDDTRFLPHRSPDHYDDTRFLPHQTPPYYPDNRHLTHQRPKHYADKRPLPHQTPKQFAAKRNLPHQRPKDCANKRHLPHPLPEGNTDKRPALPQTPEDFNYKRILRHQKLEDYADKMHSPQQKPENFADKRHTRQKMPEDFADKRILPHQKTEDFADKRDSQHQNSEDTCSGLDAIARAPPQDPMISQSDLRTKEDEGKEHREVQNCGMEECAEKACSPKRPEQHIMVSHKRLEEHHNGKRHRRMLRDISKKQKTSNGEESRHIQNSQMNPVVQTPDLPHQTPQNYADMKCLPHQTLEPTIPVVTTVELVHCETCDVTVPVKCLEKHNGGKKHRRMLSKPCEQSTNDGSPVENMSHEAPRFRYKEVPAEGSKRKVRDNTDAKGHVFKREVEEKTGGKYMKMNNGIRRLAKSSKPEVNDMLYSAESLVQITPSEYVASPKMASIPAEGSLVPVPSLVFTPAAAELSFEPSIQIDSQTEVAEGKEHHEVQHYGVETNDQPHSISMEFHAPAGSDSGAIVIAPPQAPIASQVSAPIATFKSSFESENHQVIQTETSKSKVHNEIQNHTVDSNDHQRTISMELHDLAGSMTNNQTDGVNSDSVAIVVEPLASALPDAVGPNFEPLTEHGLHTETEPELSEAVVYYESQNLIEGTNIDFPQSDSMKIDGDSEVRTKTKTADGSSQVEEEMDVLSDDLGKVQLPQVSVCLKCGDEGFEETLVYCKKCEDCALHRYCLDGPVIFTEEVIWFCEDCKVVDTESSEKGEVDSSEDFVTVADPISALAFISFLGMKGFQSKYYLWGVF